jgi:hypothetical protein
MPATVLDPIRIDPSPSPHWIELDVFTLPAPQPHSKKHSTLATRLTQKAIELGMGRGPPGRLGDLRVEYVGKTNLQSRIMLMAIDASND